LTATWPATAVPALGIWVKLPLPEVLEVLVPSGVDFIVLDCEHGPFDGRTMSTMVGVARALGLTVFVRVIGHSPPDVQPALDAGADGLFVPHVDDASTARQVVDACRFPPIGRRPGSPTTRAGNWGRSSMADYVARGNTEVTIVAQIESSTAVQSATEVGGVAGLDAIFLGPFDLALSSGLSPASAEFRAMVADVETVAATVPLGGVAANAAETDTLLDRGYSFVMVGADTTLLAGAAGSLISQVKTPTRRQVQVSM